VSLPPRVARAGRSRGRRQQLEHERVHERAAVGGRGGGEQQAIKDVAAEGADLDADVRDRWPVDVG
jgi:hypothetical protein